MNAPFSVFLDTDIGPDVDDVGALALLHVLARRQGVSILGVTHCTSSAYGCGCIDVINRAYGAHNIPIGTLPKRGFLEGAQFERYNRPLAEGFPNRFPSGAPQPAAPDVLRSALQGRPDRSVVLISIGPLVNIASFIEGRTDRELVSQKVARLVSMAGCFEQAEHYPRVEWNVEMDVKAALHVLERWPTPIDFAPFETGAPVITALRWHSMPETHPVRVAYGLHSPSGRNSWDLTAVWAAIMGPEPFFAWDIGTVSMAPDGRTGFQREALGKHRVLRLAKDPKEVGEALDSYMTEI